MTQPSTRILIAGAGYAGLLFTMCKRQEDSGSSSQKVSPLALSAQKEWDTIRRLALKRRS